MDDVLSEFLRTTRDAREYKRGLAVQMAEQGYPYAAISQLLVVSEPFISKWKKAYAEHGSSGLRLGHRGSESYLREPERSEVLAWIAAQERCDLLRLQLHLAEVYAIEYHSNQSYYDLLHEAGLNWKKVQASNPKKTTNRWQPNTPK
jgi:transposase